MSRTVKPAGRQRPLTDIGRWRRDGDGQTGGSQPNVQQLHAVLYGIPDASQSGALASLKILHSAPMLRCIHPPANCKLLNIITQIISSIHLPTKSKYLGQGRLISANILLDTSPIPWSLLVDCWPPIPSAGQRCK